MKSKFLVIFAFAGFLFCCSNLFADALDNWHWRNPSPNSNAQPLPNTLNGIVFDGGKFVAVGNSGAVSISYDSLNWMESTTATTNKLNNVAYLNGLFVAVGEGGTIETSSNGTNWTLQSSGTLNSLRATAYGNGKYLAAGSNVVSVSSDGANWSSSISTNFFTGLTYGSSGFMAVTGGSQVFLLSDGATWTGETIYQGPFYTNGSAVFPIQHEAVIYTGGIYYVSGWRYAGLITLKPYVFTSSDGVNWSTNMMPSFGSTTSFNEKCFIANGAVPALMGASLSGGTVYWQSFDGTQWNFNYADSGIIAAYAGAYGNGTNVLLGPATMVFAPGPTQLAQACTSVNGINWSNRLHVPSAPAGPNYNFTTIAFSNGIYIAGSATSIARSTNDLTYATTSNSPPLTAIITFTNGFVGVGTSGNLYLSSDGLTWTQKNSGTANNLHSIANGNGLLVAVGDSGAIQTSSTGNIWTTRLSGTSLPLYGICYSSGIFVAVGKSGTVLTSPDGINWTGQDPRTLTNLLSVTYGTAGFLAVGPGGTILTSLDGANWTPQNSGTTASFESATFGNGYYLIAGDNSVTMTSPDGVNWTSRNIGATDGQNLYGSAFLNGRFDIAGSSGTILESDIVMPPFNLQIRHTSDLNAFTIFSGTNGSFRIQSCTNLSTPAWMDETNISNPGAITSWTNPISGSQKFYRLVSP